MAAMKWQEREDALEESLQRFLKDISERYGNEIDAPAARIGRGAAPSVSLLDVGPTFIIQAEIPGVAPSMLKVTAGSRSVLIEGSWRPPLEEEEGCAIIDESSRGRFKREIELPEPVAGDLAVAVLENGILEIELPKCAERAAESHTIRLS